MRARDAVIPAGEQLYRTVEADWVDGNRVLWLAIDGEGTSCARSAYSGVGDTLAIAKIKRPAENGLAAITSQQLPVDFLASNGISYDVFSFDDPVPDYEAHCEIRWRRANDRPSTDHLKKVRGAARAELKTAIADRMVLLVAPTRPRDPALSV